MSKKTKRSISTFAILLAVMLLVSIATWLAAGKTYTGENGEMAEVVGASASDIFMGPVNGFADASDVITFVFCLGAFLAIVNATGALETGIHTLVRKLHGKELVLIWILMFLFLRRRHDLRHGRRDRWLLHSARRHDDGRRL